MTSKKVGVRAMGLAKNTVSSAVRELRARGFLPARGQSLPQNPHEGLRAGISHLALRSGMPGIGEDG